MKFTRKNIRLSTKEYRGRRTYFVTLCAHRRERLFTEEGTIRPLLESLREVAGRHQFGVHAYCFMPDHVHLLVEGISEESDLLRFLSAWKQGTGYRLRERRGARLWQFEVL